jgi:hypothetical protein
MAMRFFFLVCDCSFSLIFPIFSSLQPPFSKMELRVASWNLCGLGKLSRWPENASWLLDHDIVMIQESLQVTKTFPMFDFSRYDVHATATSGRARGGLIIALQNRVFHAARVTVLLEEEFMLLLRVEIPSSDLTLVLGNVYAPVHSAGFTPEILRTIGSQLELVSAQHPTASFLIAGSQKCPYFFMCVFQCNFDRLQYWVHIVFLKNNVTSWWRHHLFFQSQPFTDGIVFGSNFLRNVTVRLHSLSYLFIKFCWSRTWVK